jgi:hypothetical protein
MLTVVFKEDGLHMYFTEDQELSIKECIKNIEVLRKWEKTDFADPSPENISQKVLEFYQRFCIYIEYRIEADKNGKILF